MTSLPLMSILGNQSSCSWMPTLLHGCGVVKDTEAFHTMFPVHILQQELSMCHLETLNAVMAVKWSMRNYVSRVRCLHKKLSLTPDATDSFPVTSFLYAADIALCVPPLRCIPILPRLLHQLCLLSSSLGPIGPTMWMGVLTFGFFGTLRQSNLAPPTPAQLNASRHTCRGNIIPAPPGLLIVVRWTKTHQSINTAPVLPIPEVPGHPANPMDTFYQLHSTFSLLQP